MTESSVATETVEIRRPATVTEQAGGARTKTYGKTAKVGALWSIGRESVTQLLGIPTTVVLARVLSPADFGIAAAATVFTLLGKRLGNMGLNTALVRMKEVREEHRASVFVVNMVVGLATWAILMVSAPWIGSFYRDDRVSAALRLASTIFLVNFFGAVEHAALQRDMKFKQIAIVEWTYPAVAMPVSLGMAWAGWGYWSLVAGQVIASIATTGTKVYFGRWRPSLAVTRRGLVETLPFGMGIYAKRLLTYAGENLDSLIVGGLFGVTSLGYYDKAFNAADNLSNRMGFGSAAMFRIFAIIQEDRARLVRAYSKAVLAGTITTLPVFAGLIVAAHEFIVVVFGQKWLPAVVPFQFLCAAGALRIVTSYASAAVQANGQIWGEVWRKIAQVLLLVALVLAFRPLGIQGAAIGVFLCTLVLTVLMQGLVGRIVGLSIREIVTPMVPGCFAAAVTAVVVGVVTATTKYLAATTPDWLLLILQLSAGAGVWAAFTLFNRFSAVQEVVDEVIDDVAPAPLLPLIARIRPRRR